MQYFQLLPSLLVREAPASAAVGVRKGVQKPGLEHKVSSDAHRKWEAFVQSEIKKLMERKEWPEIMSKLGLTFHKIMQSEASPIFDKIMGKCPVLVQHLGSSLSHGREHFFCGTQTYSFFIFQAAQRNSVRLKSWPVPAHRTWLMPSVLKSRQRL